MVEKIENFFKEKDRFAKLLGFEIVEFSKGYAKVQADIKDEYLNGADVVHGGFLFSLADYAFALSSNSHNNLSLAISANIMFQKAVSKGKLTAVAKELTNSKKIATYEVKILDEEANLIASFCGTVYRKGMEIVIP